MSLAERNYIFHEYTQSLCPICLKTIPAKIIFQENAVKLLKACPTHGEQLELLEEDVDYFLNRRNFDKPGSPSRIQTDSYRGCPFDCGLCPAHDQHTCIGLIEVTTACDLDCPICYADAGSGKHLSLGAIDKMLDFYQHAEYGQADILQLSGGEPTTHPEIIDIIRLAKSKNFRCVMLNTNGLRIATDDNFVSALKELIGNFEIYFQLDGFSSQTSLYFRGKDLTGIKQQALANLAACNIPTTLVTTVEAGVNDKELGHLIAFAVQNRNIRGVNFQPVGYFGRGKRPDKKQRITLSGIINRLEQQTSSMIKKSDFLPLPCNVERVAITYFQRNNNGIRPLLRDFNIKDRLSLIRNSFTFDLDDYARLAGENPSVLSTGFCDCMRFLNVSNNALLPPIPSTPEQRTKYLNENFLRLSVTSFIDAYNFDMKSMQKECIHVITPDLKRIPFSSYNIVHRKG